MRNSSTRSRDGVLYLDVHTRKVEQYSGNYNDVLKEITARIERENMKNAQLAKKIQDNKDKTNFFAHKGGKMRLVAKKMRDEVEEMEEDEGGRAQGGQDHQPVHHPRAAHGRARSLQITLVQDASRITSR